MNQDQQRRDWIGIGIVAAVAVVVRGAVMAAALLGVGPLDNLGDDPDSYREIAETLSATGTFGITAEDGSVDPTAFRPPLYPWVLSWFAIDGQLGNAAAGLLNALLGVLTCLGVYAVVRQVANVPHGERAGDWQVAIPPHGTAVAAGCLTAIDPLLLMQSTLVMTETFAAGIAVAAWWAAAQSWIKWEKEEGSRKLRTQRTLPSRGEGKLSIPRQNPFTWEGIFISPGGGWALALGGLLAAGYLCRPVFAVWIVLWVGWLVALFWLSSPHRRWAGRQAIAIVVVVAVTAAGWMLRNQQVIGKAVWATTHGGYTLLLGNNPYFYDYLESRSFAEAAFWGDAWDAEPFHADWAERQAEAGQARLNKLDSLDPELAADRLAGELAKEEIRRRPGMFLYASLVRVGRLWSPVPRVGDRVGPVSWAIGAFYGVLGIGVAAGVWRLRHHLLSPAWAPAFLLLLAVTAVHAVYWSNLRMRAPVMPMVAGIAAVGFLGNRKSLPNIRNSGRC